MKPKTIEQKHTHVHAKQSLGKLKFRCSFTSNFASSKDYFLFDQLSRVRKNSISRAHARTHTHTCFAEGRLDAVILSAKPTWRDFSRHRSGQTRSQEEDAFSHHDPNHRASFVLEVKWFFKPLRVFEDPSVRCPVRHHPQAGRTVKLEVAHENLSCHGVATN